MRKKTKLTSGIICFAIILALCGCGKENTKPSATETTNESVTASSSVMEESKAEESKPEESNENETNTKQPEFTIVATVGTKYATISVNVRDCPSADGNKIGTLSVNQEVKIMGQCKETGWYQLEYNGQVGYASNKYLSDEKVEVASKPANTGNNVSSGNSGDTNERIVDGHGLLALVNQDRAETDPDAGELVWDAELYAIAQQRIYVVADNYLNGRNAHDGVDGTYGENAAYIYDSRNVAYGCSFFNGQWIGSAGHHRNRTNARYSKYAAVGIYDGNGRTTFIELFR